MNKDRKIDVRLTADEYAEIERVCRGLKLSKSDYLRAVAFGGAVAKPAQSPAPAPAAGIDSERLEGIETVIDGMRSTLDEQQQRIAEIEQSLTASARAFDTLLQKLGEFIRVPSFREYRARLAVEQVEKRENEDELAFLVRIAQRYFIAHNAWPDPADSRAFGPVPGGVDISKFPKSPPR